MTNNKNIDITIKIPVDVSFIDTVEQECYQMLLQQRLLYNERWYSSALFTGTFTVLRLAGVLTSAFGVLICLFYLLYPSSCPKWFFTEIFLAFFIATGVLFYFLPWINSRIVNRLKNSGSKSCRYLAKRLFAKVKNVVPYTAEYNFKGDLVSYYRVKNDNWQQVWSRRLRGFAVVSEHATLFFRKPPSIHPTLLIMHDNTQVITSVLVNLAIEHIIVD